MGNIVVLGDSIAKGRGLKNNKDSWCNILSKYFMVNNLSGYGYDSGQILNIVKNNSKDIDIADFVICAFGVNDARIMGSRKLSHHQVSFKKNMENILDVIGPNKKIIIMGLTPINEKASSFGFVPSKVKTFNRILKTVAGEKHVFFVDAYHGFKENKVFLNDGIHLNKYGHMLIAKKLYDLLISYADKCSYINNKEIFNTFLKVKKLSRNEGIDLSSDFRKLPFCSEDFFLGIDSLNNFDFVVGGPCLRKDIDGISLNSIYQIFMPALISKRIGTKLAIFLGIQEEIIISPSLVSKYQQLSKEIKLISNKIFSRMGVKGRLIDTSQPKINIVINKNINDRAINMSAKDSTYLFDINKRNRVKKIHSESRIESSKRIFSCHIKSNLSQILKGDKYLFVEDVNQYGCIRKTSPYNDKSTSYLSFFPMPNIYGSDYMFSSSENKRLLLGKTEKYYLNKVEKMPTWVFDYYYIFLVLLNNNIHFCSLQTSTINRKEKFVKLILNLSKLNTQKKIP